MGAHLDVSVHNISQALKENGMWDNTLFIFANDNGEKYIYITTLTFIAYLSMMIRCTFLSAGGATNGFELSSNNNYPMRGGKDTLWQGGVRTLAFVRGYGIEKVFHYHCWTFSAVILVNRCIHTLSF